MPRPMNNPATEKGVRYFWGEILIAIDDAFGTGEFGSREIAELMGISIYDASVRLRRMRGFELVKIVRTEKSNRKVCVITNNGRRMIKHMKKKGER